jgi:hypothetical protein
VDTVTEGVRVPSRRRRLKIIAGALVLALCGVAAWSRAVRLEQLRWIETAREAGLFVHDEPYRDEWQGPIDLKPFLKQLGPKYVMVLVRTNDEAEKLLSLTESFDGRMVVLYTPQVSSSLVGEIERRFPSTETIDWQKRFRPKYQGEWLVRRLAQI